MSRGVSSKRAVAVEVGVECSRGWGESFDDMQHQVPALP